MHISDWLPTIYSLAGGHIGNLPQDLDGISHFGQIFGKGLKMREHRWQRHELQEPRQHMLYWNVNTKGMFKDQPKRYTLMQIILAQFCSNERTCCPQNYIRIKEVCISISNCTLYISLIRYRFYLSFAHLFNFPESKTMADTNQTLE